MTKLKTNKKKCTYCKLKLPLDDYTHHKKICDLCHKYKQLKSLYIIFE